MGSKLRAAAMLSDKARRNSGVVLVAKAVAWLVLKPARTKKVIRRERDLLEAIGVATSACGIAAADRKLGGIIALTVGAGGDARVGIAVDVAALVWRLTKAASPRVIGFAVWAACGFVTRSAVGWGRKSSGEK